jgi:hypothetical protein
MKSPGQEARSGVEGLQLSIEEYVESGDKIGFECEHEVKRYAAANPLLQPAVGATGAIRGSQPLRHDALAAERTSLPVDDCAIRDAVRVERNARMLAAQQGLKGTLAGFDRLATQIPVPADQVEHRKSVLIGDDCLAVDELYPRQDRRLPRMRRPPATTPQPLPTPLQLSSDPLASKLACVTL